VRREEGAKAPPFLPLLFSLLILGISLTSIRTAEKRKNKRWKNAREGNKEKETESGTFFIFLPSLFS